MADAGLEMDYREARNQIRKEMDVARKAGDSQTLAQLRQLEKNLTKDHYGEPVAPEMPSEPPQLRGDRRNPRETQPPSWGGGLISIIEALTPNQRETIADQARIDRPKDTGGGFFGGLNYGTDVELGVSDYGAEAPWPEHRPLGNPEAGLGTPEVVHGDMPIPPFQPEALPMTEGVPMTQEDIQLPDAFGVPHVSTQDNATQKQVIDNLTTGDTGRGGEAFDPATGISDEGPLAGARGKMLDWMNIDNDEHAQRLGSAMLAFGSGVLTGGSDLGAAVGHGFAKGADQFVSTKKDQTQRMADLQSIEQADLRLDMEREKFDEWRRDTARKRSGEMPDGLVKLERDKKIASSGYIQDENGQWIEDPNYVKDPYSNITDKKIRSQIEMLDLALKTGKITEEQYQQGIMSLTGFEGLGV